jgi:hypothetical protein
LVRTTVTGEEVFYGTWYSGGRRLKRRIGAKRGRNERSGGLTTNQAEERLRRMIAETVARPRVEGRMEIAELGALYIANARRRGRKRSTLLNIESYVRVHFEPFFGDRPVDTIEPRGRDSADEQAGARRQDAQDDPQHPRDALGAVQLRGRSAPQIRRLQPVRRH